MKNNSKKIRRMILRIVVMVIAGIFLGTQIYSWNAKSLGGDAMPMPLGFGVSIVLSGSMEPELSVNDLIFVRQMDSYEVRDVVVFQSYGSLVVHRILEIDGENVVTQGDANDTADDPIALTEIKGEVVGHVPYVGAILRFLKTPIGIVLVLGAAILLMELSFQKEKKEAEQDLEPIKEEIRRLLAEQAQKDDTTQN
ncbi:MAG: signal peptidase I [Clostridia bacterium]|nr:signal peptidase I [Clostridia bacterium]